MTGPVIPEGHLADLRVVQESGLRFRAYVERAVEQTADNGEVTTTWVEVASNVPCLLVPMGPRDAEWAAARGIVATGILKQRLLGPMDPADRAVVRGVMSGVRVQHFVKAVADLSRPGRVVRRLAVVDVDISRVA